MISRKFIDLCNEHHNSASELFQPPKKVPSRDLGQSAAPLRVSVSQPIKGGQYPQHWLAE